MESPPWAVGVYINLPIDYPLDHPDLHPIWQAIDDAGLCFIHHSFSQGYPGYRDLWNNPFLGRTASHPWGAMRAMGAFFGAGLFDRYPNLRFAMLESGFGWLPFWVARMEDQAHYMGFVAEGLQHTMWNTPPAAVSSPRSCCMKVARWSSWYRNTSASTS